MEKVILYYDNNLDYLFEIENIEYLEKAIEYKNEKLENNDFCMSDFEYILEYLNKNNIKFDYIELWNIKKLEY